MKVYQVLKKIEFSFTFYLYFSKEEKRMFWNVVEEKRIFFPSCRIFLWNYPQIFSMFLKTKNIEEEKSKL